MAIKRNFQIQWNLLAAIKISPKITAVLLIVSAKQMVCVSISSQRSVVLPNFEINVIWNNERSSKNIYSSKQTISKKMFIILKEMSRKKKEKEEKTVGLRQKLYCYKVFLLA